VDAAAVLYGVNRLFSLGLSIEKLQERGVGIGADIPYCLMGGTVLAEGIGEKLRRISPFPECMILIAKPGFSVSTAHVYQSLNLEKVEFHPDIDEIISAIEEKDITRIGEKMGNVLEEVTVKEHPLIQEIKEEMLKSGAIAALMSGSGPTVFGIFEDKKKLNEANIRIKKADWQR
jgi:4-diphosphocytidyl-2-C-methyl-D-erythritol kinase